MKYAINVYETYHKEPTVLVISVGRPVPQNRRRYWWMTKEGHHYWVLKDTTLLHDKRDAGKLSGGRRVAAARRSRPFFHIAETAPLSDGETIRLLCQTAKEELEKKEPAEQDTFLPFVTFAYNGPSVIEEIKTEAYKLHVISTICRQTEKQFEKYQVPCRKSTIEPFLGESLLSPVVAIAYVFMQQRVFLRTQGSPARAGQSNHNNRNEGVELQHGLR
ncbi:uncharacterized protein BYT42DRAFT_294595 [Radiomyces spectabilis]|uniref:uncharacterized protein n=1 Tax=Radiomyces spectabilis TaxID=64574 RepID=UPI00221EF962|nr:uncharacterized protein BYT42DRAFT_294595 [Radiomyces spectabilis]KAI8381154.1 hypothetical protein BYT42DRAFT_294595 [Radiomyces spectabilis]